MAGLLILFLVTNTPARAALGRLFDWMDVDRANPAPTQILTLAGNTPTHTRIAELPRHLPEYGLPQYPTPGFSQAGPDRPSIIPTPGVNQH
jgi:hypothetical protein